MPQASAATQAEFRKHFGENADDSDALRFLEQNGITDQAGYIKVTDEQLMNDKIYIACRYLAEEWDYSF